MDLSLPETRYLLWSLQLRAETDTVRRSMTALFIALLAAFRSSVRSRLELQTEILALRHQLAVLQRQAPKRPRLGRVDRLLWVLLSRLWPNWRRAVQIVTLDTVVRWHRRGFALYWRWRSRPRRMGRPAVPVPIRELIRHMHAANPLYVKPAWTAQQLREAWPWDTAPRFVIRDRDGIYGLELQNVTQDLDIEEVLTAPRSPWQNPSVERVIGSLRHECLDHIIVWNERSLRRYLQQYLAYYHEWRTHLSLDKDAPFPRAVQPPTCSTIVQVPHLGGLHHHYERRAA